MKRFITFLVLTAVSLCAFAQPFGLKKGMTLDEIAKVCGGVAPVKLEEDRYQICPVQNDFNCSLFVVWVDAKQGLYCIKALSQEIQSNKNGTEIKNEFNAMQSKLSKLYGKAEVVDTIAPNSKLKSSSKWTMALGQGDRQLYATWYPGEGEDLPDDLSIITLTAMAEFGIKGYLMLEYEFTNYNKVKSIEDFLSE